jgi:hypothetical protein
MNWDVQLGELKPYWGQRCRARLKQAGSCRGRAWALRRGWIHIAPTVSNGLTR